MLRPQQENLKIASSAVIIRPLLSASISLSVISSANLAYEFAID